jgi:hypothetical protein
MTLKCRDDKPDNPQCRKPNGEPCWHAVEHERTEWCNGLCPIVHKVETCKEVKDA